MAKIQSTEPASLFTGLPKLTQLQNALLKTGTRIFDQEQIESYKGKRLRRTRACEIAVTLGGAFLICAGLLSFIAGALCWLLSSRFPIPLWMPCAIAAGLSLAFTAYLATAYLDSNFRAAYLSHWASDWSGEIPPQARAILGRLEAEMPHGVLFFSVEFLKADPFLYVMEEEEDSSYCVCWWDEKGFRPTEGV